MASITTTTAAKLAIRTICKVNKTQLCNASKSSKASFQQLALFSTEGNAKTKEFNPGDFVAGVTHEDLEKDPKLQEYFASNFPDQFGKGDDDNDIRISYDYLSRIEEGAELFAEEIAEAAAAEGAASLQKESSGNLSSEEIDVSTLPSELSRNIRPFLTYKRDLDTEEGSRQCRKLRETTNMIPGIIFGADPTKNIVFNDESHKMLVKTPMRFIQRELDRFTAAKFESRVYDLTVLENDGDTEGEVIRVMPRDVNFHPIYNKIYCCNYIRYHPGRLVNIPIVYINEEESPAMKRGGFIAPVNRYVPCIVEDGVKIPDGIELDCTGVLLKEVIRKNRLIFPDGVTAGKKVKEDFLIGTVFGRKADIGTQVVAAEDSAS